MNELVKKDDNLLPALMKEVEDKIVVVRGQKTLLDFHVAAVYGVETREVNQAVRNNPRKFPEGYVLELTKEESSALRSKLLTLEDPAATLKPVKGKGRFSKYNFKAFTRKGLYMLATCLKSDRAADATIAIVETFDKVQTLKQELLELHNVLNFAASICSATAIPTAIETPCPSGPPVHSTPSVSPNSG